MHQTLTPRQFVSTQCSTLKNNRAIAKFPCQETEISQEKIILDSLNLDYDNFDIILLEAIDEVFSSLGNLAKEAIYEYLEKDFKISKGEIPKKLKHFVKALESLLGVGANLIEIEIMRRLYQKTGDLKYITEKRRCNFSFTRYVTILRKQYAKKLSH